MARQIFFLRQELDEIVTGRKVVTQEQLTRLLAEIALFSAIKLEEISAGANGEGDWTYENANVLTVRTKIVKVQPGDVVRLKIYNWDYEDNRTVYVGKDQHVTVDNGIPIQPGEELEWSVKQDLYALSPYVGEATAVRIVTGVNDTIDFDEGAGALVGTIAPGTYYLPVDLYAAFATALNNAVGSGSNYTGSWSAAANKITITSDGAGGIGQFNLRWNTGPNALISAGVSLGYDVTADDVGALAYQADNAITVSENPVRVRIGRSIAVKRNRQDFF